MTENIENHIALACECGCVTWYWLKSKKLECTKCGLIKEVTNEQAFINNS